MSNVVCRNTIHTPQGAVTINTCFLGRDVGIPGTAQSFETNVWGGTQHGRSERYATRAEALAGHDAVVEAVRRGDPPVPDKPWQVCQVDEEGDD